MNKKLLSIIILFSITISSLSQKKKDILLTIDDDPVLVSEFNSVYNKNLELVIDESQKSVEGYLDLFIDYKLKIAEAYSQELEKDKDYKIEFSKYREQLSRNYFYEDKVISELVKEAYERGLEEINVNHILILSNYGDLPQDTLIAYNKMKLILDKAKNGEDFEALAKKYSEEPGVDKNAGRLGYFNVFTMVYPFETEAYNTKEGEVSEIVRTQYGYHIIKVNKRRKKEPEISVSHIMISNKKETTRTFDPEERINELYAMLEQGESFENIAKQFSDDKNSAINGGKLNRFSKGELRSNEFENAAYSIKIIGEISKPIESEFGWHIIRLDEIYSIATFEDKKEMLEKSVSDGSRSKIVTQMVNKKIIEKYGFEKGVSYNPYFKTFVADTVTLRRWVYTSIPAVDNKVLFTIGERGVTYNDFAAYIKVRQRTSKRYRDKGKLLKDYYIEFESVEIKNYFIDMLEIENEEFAAIINDYRNGLLIFDVMEKNIWKKAKRDSVGLQKFYEETKSQYYWEKRVDVIIVSATEDSIARKAQELLKQDKTEEQIKEQLNTDNKINVIITSGVFEIDQRELPEKFNPELGVSSLYNVEASFVVVRVIEVIPPKIKTLEEIKGKVINNYQGYLEDIWMQELREKYTVVINKKVLKRIKKELNP